MVTISKISFAASQPKANTQNIQNRYVSISQQALKQDIVSFSGKQSKYTSDVVMDELKKAKEEFDNETFFFEKLLELCKWPSNDHLYQEVDGYAQSLQDKSKETAFSLLDLIEKDNETYPILKKNAKYLRERVGINPNPDEI
ncbi:MAG: hypothetical protein WC197_07425 [Candidatus Gastranaerophilaceae bacterium]|jgi:hypothetical protein